MTHPSTTIRRSLLATVIKVILTLIVLFFVYQQTSTHWQQIKDFSWSFNFYWLAGSIVVGLATFFLFSLIWRAIIARLGNKIGPLPAFRVFYLSNLGRYIPGKIWQLLGILYLAGQEGIPRERATASFILAQLYAIPASFLVFVIAAQWEPRILVDRVALLGSYSGVVLIVGMLVICIFLILYPHRILSLGNRLLKRFGRPSLEFAPDKKVALLYLVVYSVAWIGYGTAFWMFVKSVVPETGLGLVAAIGLFNLAYQIGYLALFAPGGFGPRELVLGMLMVPFVGPIAPAVAVLARIWAILVETIAAIAALTVKKQ